MMTAVTLIHYKLQASLNRDVEHVKAYTMMSQLHTTCRSCEGLHHDVDHVQAEAHPVNNDATGGWCRAKHEGGRGGR